MILTKQQTTQAVAEARKMIQEHSTGFMNYSAMVSDAQIAEALTRVLGAVTDATQEPSGS